MHKGMVGFIKIHRKILNWEWIDDPNVVVVFFHCLLKANFKRIKWHGIQLEKGEFITSSFSLAQQSGLSRQKVRTALSKLKSTNELTTRTTNKYTVVKVEKWADYQLGDSETNQQHNQQLTINQPATNQQLTTGEERKERKESIKKEGIFTDAKEKADGAFSSSAENTQIPYAKIKKLWNEKAGLQNIRSVTKRRKGHVAARYKQVGWEGIEEIIDKVSKSKFLHGNGDRGWIATFDWLFLNETNFTKTLEGKYDDENMKFQNGEKKGDVEVDWFDKYKEDLENEG